MADVIPFEEYGISRETGFTSELPESLPDYYKPWHELASKMADLVASQTMREEAHKLPLLDTSHLRTSEELKLAYLQLCIISSGYCWEKGPQGLPTLVPSNVAIPLCSVSDKLGVEPGMTYFCLQGNWKRIDKSRPFTFDNLTVRYVLLGGQQYVEFITRTVYTEILFAKTFPAIEDILWGSKFSDPVKVASGLKYLTKWVKEFLNLAKEYHTIMQPDVFFKQIGLLFHGFNESCDLPNGMLFEGVNDRPYRTVKNTAASQSTIFQIIDVLLRVDYPQDKEDYFHKLRETWPPEYQKFFQFLWNWPGNIREMVRSGRSEELSRAYNKLLHMIQQFRNLHIQLVTRFVIIPNKRLREEIKATGTDPTSAVIPLLQDIRNTTAATRLQ